MITCTQCSPYFFIVFDSSRGEHICTGCGVVLSEYEWVSNGPNLFSEIKPEVSCDDKILNPIEHQLSYLESIFPCLSHANIIHMMHEMNIKYSVRNVVTILHRVGVRHGVDYEVLQNELSECFPHIKKGSDSLQDHASENDERFFKWSVMITHVCSKYGLHHPQRQLLTTHCKEYLERHQVSEQYMHHSLRIVVMCMLYYLFPERRHQYKFSLSMKTCYNKMYIV